MRTLFVAVYFVAVLTATTSLSLADSPIELKRKADKCKHLVEARCGKGVSSDIFACQSKIRKQLPAFCTDGTLDNSTSTKLSGDEAVKHMEENIPHSVCMLDVTELCKRHFSTAGLTKEDLECFSRRRPYVSKECRAYLKDSQSQLGGNF